MADRDSTEMPNVIFYSGGLMAFGITTLLMVGINYFMEYLGIDESPSLSIVQAFLIFLLAGAIVGYAVANKADGDYIRVGIKTGLFTSFINVSMMYINKSFTGALWAICGSILGGCLGGIIYSRKASVKSESEV
jgi:hypothetical protein